MHITKLPLCISPVSTDRNTCGRRADRCMHFAAAMCCQEGRKSLDASSVSVCFFCAPDSTARAHNGALDGGYHEHCYCDWPHLVLLGRLSKLGSVLEMDVCSIDRLSSRTGLG